MSDQATPVTAEDLQAFLKDEYGDAASVFQVDAVGDREATIRLSANASMMRPGNVVMGPMMMALADVAIYCALCVAVGPTLQAHTANLNISFLRKAQPGDVLAQARVLKVGRSLVYGEADMRSAAASEDAMVAHATASFSLGG